MGSEGEWELLHAEEEKPCSRGNSLCKGPVVGVWTVTGQMSESCGRSAGRGPMLSGLASPGKGLSLNSAWVFQQGC